MADEARSPETKGDRRRTFALLVVAGICHAALMFESWGWPAIDGYPTIERFLDPGYLTTDFYTNTSRGYGVDTAQSYLFGSIQQLTGLHYDVQLAALNLLRCLTFPGLVYAFLLALSGRRLVALSGALFGVVSNFALPKTLGWAWVWGDPSTAMFAIPAIVLAWTYLLRRRALGCFLCLAFAAAMHPLASLHGCIVVGTILLFDYTPDERRALLRSPSGLAGAGVFGAVFASQYLLLKADPKDQLPIGEYVTIMAYERHPGDFLPSRFSAGTCIAFTFGALAVLVVLWRLWGELPRRKLVVGTLGVYVGVCLLGWLFVEVVPLRFFVQLIPFRTANVGAPFMLYVLACFVGRALEERRYLTFGLLLALAFGASQHAGHLFGARGALLEQLAPLGLLVLALATLLAKKPLPESLEARFAPIFGERGFVLSLAALLSVLAVAGAYARREAFVLPREANQHPLYAWMRARSAEDSTFLVDQFPRDYRFGGAVNPQKVRLVGRRAVVASLDFPFLDRDMRAWFERWKLVLAGRTPDRVDSADLATLTQLRKAFPFQYVVRHTPLAEGPGVTLEASFPPWHRAPKVLVYRFSG